MTEAEALTRLERMTAPDMDPTLSTDDLEDLLAQAQRVDADGLLPSDTGWTETWDLDAAASAAWEVKAGRAAAGFRFSEDGQTFNREQIHSQCLAMAKLYRRGAGSVQISSSLVDRLVTRTPVD